MRFEFNFFNFFKMQSFCPIVQLVLLTCVKLMAFMGLMKQIYGDLPNYASIIFAAQRPSVIAVRSPDHLMTILSETFTCTSVQVPMFVPQSTPEQPAIAPPLV